MKRVSSIIVVVTLLLCAAYTPANAAAAKDWTLAVFLNADNNLDPFGVEDQEEMAKVGSNDFLNIVSLIDRERGPAQINYVEKNNIKKVKDMGELDMGDYRQLVNFAKFVKENYPAKKYCFVIWNHGSGWKNKTGAAVYRGISYDDSSNNHITNAQLSVATAEMSKVLGQKIDILTMDACLMQMVEVGHAIKDNVRFMVASEELEPGKGAPYDDVLKGVKSGMSPEAFATNWVNAFAKSYMGGSQGYDESTQSAVDYSKFGPLVDSVNGLAKALMSGKNAMIVKAAVAKTQKFGDPGNIDLIHFAELLKAATGVDASVKTACDKVIAAAKAAIINNKVTGTSTKNAKGIAIYLPANLVLETKYSSLSFAKETMWDDMIVALGKKEAAERVVAEVIAGNLEEMKSMLEAASQNPDDETYRIALRELNFAVYAEKLLPAAIEGEFTSLFEAFKNTITNK
ncbi:MAG: clostripain-related cysteine peptidase [Candidatus Riflebacteria bacterium]|jgi:hypothetical protein|nr:clostripain-related cysteine peptidase [Candidatus Riflebacteria bacterium]